MSHIRTDDDPPPVPPVRPEPEDCCHGGCERCVFDLYEEAQERYELARQAWEARRKRRTVPSDPR